MGAFLQKPITNKQTDVGSGNRLQYALAGMQGWRRTMEDEHFAECELGAQWKGCSMFGVYDGHGGDQAARIVREKMWEMMQKIPFTPDFSQALTELYYRLDQKMYAAGDKYSNQGCTAITTLIKGNHTSVANCGEYALLKKNQATAAASRIVEMELCASELMTMNICNHISVANCGDSRLIIGTRDGTVRLGTHDHKPVSPTERSRIETAGGHIQNVQGHFRVCGNLNLSRALGDLRYKRNEEQPPSGQMICGVPDCIEFELIEQDELLILACDGIWDVMSNEACLHFCQNRLRDDHSTENLQRVVNQLLDHCCSPSLDGAAVTGTDNMTCIIVSLRNACVPVKPALILELDEDVTLKDMTIYHPVEKQPENRNSLAIVLERGDWSEKQMIPLPRGMPPLGKIIYDEKAHHLAIYPLDVDLEAV